MFQFRNNICPYQIWNSFIYNLLTVCSSNEILFQQYLSIQYFKINMNRRTIIALTEIDGDI